MAQEANALGNARDRLTWAGYTGRHRRRKVKGLMTGVFDVLKTAEYNQSSAIQPVQVSSHDDGKVQGSVVVVPMTTARMLKSRMRRKPHVRFGNGGGAGDRPADRSWAGGNMTLLP